MKSMEARRAELYEHIAAKASSTACELGIDKMLADHLAAAVVDGFVEDVGGEVLSFPKDAAFRLSQREMEILDRHRKGDTFAQLARDYNMGERGMRKLIKRAQLRNPAFNQPELFSA